MLLFQNQIFYKVFALSLVEFTLFVSKAVMKLFGLYMFRK